MNLDEPMICWTRHQTQFNHKSMLKHNQLIHWLIGHLMLVFFCLLQ